MFKPIRSPQKGVQIHEHTYTHCPILHPLSLADIKKTQTNIHKHGNIKRGLHLCEASQTIQTHTLSGRQRQIDSEDHLPRAVSECKAEGRGQDFQPPCDPPVMTSQDTSGSEG